MIFRRPRIMSFTERRRRQLAMKWDRLDRLETRNTITEPISVTGLAISTLRGLTLLGTPYAASNALSGLRRPSDVGTRSGSSGGNPFVFHGNLLEPLPDIGSSRHTGAAGGSSGAAPGTADTATRSNQGASSDWLNLSNAPAGDAPEAHGISAQWHPAKGAGGGAALPPRGGSSASGSAGASARGAITPLRLPASTPAASNAGGASAALLAAVAGAGGAGAASGSVGAGSAAAASHVSLVHAAPAGSTGQTSHTGQGTGGGLTLSPDGDPGPGSSGGALPGSTPDPVISNFSEPSLQTFTWYPVYVHDNNNGVVLYPGVEQLATFGGHVDLIAQVSGTTVSSYSWDTTHLNDVNTVAGTTSDELTFHWNSNNLSAAFVDPVTLSVTDTNSHTETFTYDFWVPTGSGTAGSGGTNATWPTSLAPSAELLTAPTFPTDNATVDATSGSLDTEIDLPSYNPNVPAIALTYDSVTANPEPIIVFENTIPSTVPSQVSAQLTFNGGTPLTTYYYGTSTLNPGDVQQVALEATNATALATNRYTYSGQFVDVGSGLATQTYSGSTTLLNYASNTFGAGWTLQGLEQITPESGGVILDLGDNGRTLWFRKPGQRRRLLHRPSG